MEKNQKTTNFKLTIRTIIWIVRLVFSFSPRLFMAVICSQLFATILPFAEQKYLSNLIDALISSYNQKNNLWLNIFLIFLSIRVVKIILLNFQRIFHRLLEYRVSNDIRKLYINKTSSLDYQQFEDKKIASLISKVREEYQWRTRQIISDIFNLLVQSLSFITVIVLLLPRYWYIAILLFIGEIPGLLIDKKWQKIDWKTFNHYNEKTRPGWDAQWQLTNKRYTAELKISQAVNWLKSKFTDSQDEFTAARIQNRIDKFIPDLISSQFSTIIVALCLVFIIKDINLGIISIGMFTFYFGIIRSTGDYFGGILNNFISISEQTLYIDKFKTIIELPRIINNGHITSNLITSPEIEFRNVFFKYPNTKRYIFKNLNLTIKPGEEIAIVGPNGAGKSTLIKLLCRFYDPTSGTIFINNQDIKDFDVNYWYRHLSLLTQEFNTYENLSLAENITIGAKFTKNQVISALKKSQAYEFVKKYKNGLNSMMSQRYDGEEPSWGQWQKIAIARIFFRNTPVMILDEPTASIDAIAESKIFTHLYKQIRRKTLIIVSHRFSTVRNAQRIIVIDKGQIVEQGSHQELISQQGLYAKSFKIQAEGYN